MKTLFTIFLLCFFLTHTTAQTPLYLSFVSHNETSDPLDYDHPTDPSFYNQIKTIATAVCDTIIAKQAKYNMQVDANLIFGALLHDNAATNPNDLLEWANNSPFIDVDGHNHFNVIQNPYNYADLAYLLDSCGVILNKNILGGVSWKAPTEDWTQYEMPVAGYTFSDYIWQADILWGPATPGHTDDYEAFGIWKPNGPTPLAFGQHNPANTLTCIGGGCKSDIGFVLNPNGTPKRTTGEIITNLKAMADYINAIPPQPNAFFTANMLINFRDFTEVPNFADSIATIINGVQDYVAEGKIIWLTLAEKQDLWLASHPDPADFFLYQCDDVVLTAASETPPPPAMTLFP
ncbi:MAG: hypothetical protein ACE5FF_14035, partial [Saprospiraceae bacterium]